MKHSIGRRATLAGGVSLAAASLVRPREARAATSLTVVLESEATILDPHFTTAAITRTFGLHIFDMLFAMNEKGEMKPQMVDSWEASSDKLGWTFVLRDGLKMARWLRCNGGRLSLLRRWGARDALGKMLLTATASLDATDARTFRFALKEPFPLMLEVLGKPNAPLPVMMSARLAATPPDQRIPEPIGSGPFRFVKNEWRPGNTMLLERNPDYVPRKEAPDFLAGGKKVKIDQLTLRVMPDQSTGANALIAGEIEYMQYLPFDILPVLEKEKALRFIGLGGIHQFQGNFRLNHEAPPFNNPAVRRILWKLVDQDATLTAIGVPEKYRAKSCPSFFMCGAPLSSEVGSAGNRFDMAAAKAELAASGYKGEPVIIPRGLGLDQPDRLEAPGPEHARHRIHGGAATARLAHRPGAARQEGGLVDVSGLLQRHRHVLAAVAPLYRQYPQPRLPGVVATNAFLPLKVLTQVDAEERRKIAADIQAAAHELTPSVMWGNSRYRPATAATSRD